MGFTEDLARRAHSLRLETVPDAAIEVAKATLLDTIGVALAGRTERVVRIAEKFVRNDEQAGPSTIWGTPFRAGASRAAFVNGTASHALDYDDVCWAMNAHPSAVLWPAALAVGQLRGASGAEVLASYVAGFEAAADLGTVLGAAHYAAGFHPTSTIGTLSATVTAGHLMRLPLDGLRRALGVACSKAAGARINFGTDTKPLHAGFAAESGVAAARLAELGATARLDAVEGPMGLSALYAGTSPGSERRSFALLDPGVELKPYPSCRFTHRIIDATLAIRERHASAPVVSIDCVVDPFAPSVVIYPRPSNGLEAKFSMEYSAAVAWLDGRVGVDAYADDRVNRDDVRDLCRRVTVATGSNDQETVRVTFGDGSDDEQKVRDAKGSPARPLTETELFAKFESCAAPLLGRRTVHVAETVRKLESLRTIDELMSLLTP
jgi:2-methylcitrate dehydratase PrpD